MSKYLKRLLFAIFGFDLPIGEIKLQSKEVELLRRPDKEDIGGGGIKRP